MSTTTAFAITGQSKLCDEIGYLSTSCKSVELLPMEYKDKDVALAKAKQPITYSSTTTNVYVSKEQQRLNEIQTRIWAEEK